MQRRHAIVTGALAGLLVLAGSNGAMAANGGTPSANPLVGAAHWQAASGPMSPKDPAEIQLYTRTKGSGSSPAVRIYLSSTSPPNALVTFYLVYPSGKLVPGNTGASTRPGGSRSNFIVINTGVPAGTSFRVAAMGNGQDGSWQGEMYY
jgi:hypothetical protein